MDRGVWEFGCLREEIFKYRGISEGDGHYRNGVEEMHGMGSVVRVTRGGVNDKQMIL